MIGIKNLADNPNVYIRLDKEFVRDLLRSISCGFAPRTSATLAELLGVTYNYEFNVSPTISNWLDGKRAIPIVKLTTIIELSEYSWEDISTHILTIKGPKRDVGLRPKFPIRIDKKLGSIVGHILGDGSIDKVHRQISFSNTNKQLLEEFRIHMKDLFHIEPRIWCQNKPAFKTEWRSRCDCISDIPDGHNGILFYPTIVSEILYAVLGEFAKGKSKRIPILTFAAPDDYKIGLTRAFFDDEACVALSSYSIRVFQDCRELLEGIRRLLISLGIEPNNVHHYIKRAKKRHYFDVTSYEYLKKFRDIIGFTSTAKMDKLDKMVRTINNSVTFRLRNNQSTEYILSLLKSNGMSTTQLRRALKMKYPRLKWNQSTLVRKLNDLAYKGTLLKITRGKSHFWTCSKK